MKWIQLFYLIASILSYLGFVVYLDVSLLLWLRKTPKDNRNDNGQHPKNHSDDNSYLLPFKGVLGDFLLFLANASFLWFVAFLRWMVMGR